jgi:hypothetical protein
MNRAHPSILTTLLLTLPLAGSLAAVDPGEAAAQDSRSPPSAFIATTSPEYFDGRPVYWWDGSWFYRDGNRWNFYHDEPPTLRGLRGEFGNRARYLYHR